MKKIKNLKPKQSETTIKNINSLVYKIANQHHNFSNIGDNKITRKPNTFVKDINYSTLDNLKKKQFINNSGQNIPKEIACHLQLGPNFSLPPNNKKKITIEIVNIENNIEDLNTETQLKIRNRIIPLINNTNINYDRIIKHKQLNTIKTITKQFLNYKRLQRLY